MLPMDRTDAGALGHDRAAQRGSALRRRLAATALAAGLIALPGSAASAAPIAHTPAGSASARAYWTPQRMRAAPLLHQRRAPAPAQAGSTALGALGAAGAAGAAGAIDPLTSRPPRPPAGGLAARVSAPPFDSGQVAPATMTSYPYSANGRLYGVLPRIGGYSCSATVVNSPSHNVVLTAGHCVYDHKVGWARKLLFVPAYLNGQRPFGAWAATRLASTRSWLRRGNEHGDYAAIKLNSPNGPVGKAVGEEGLAWSLSREQQFEAIGYPFNRGRTQLMWHCTSASIGADPLDRTPGKADTGIGCDMGQGSSGGGWTIRDGSGDAYVNGVTSYFYTHRLKHILFSPYLTRGVVKVVNLANRG